MNKKQLRDENILKHGFKLQRIFPKSKDMGPVSLYEALLRIEKRAHRLAERECSEPLPNSYIDRAEAAIMRDVIALLGSDVPVMLNGDPRGYALKIDDAVVKERKLDIHTDWGGYGILAPEF